MKKNTYSLACHRDHGVDLWSSDGFWLLCHLQVTFSKFVSVYTDFSHGPSLLDLGQRAAYYTEICIIARTWRWSEEDKGDRSSPLRCSHCWFGFILSPLLNILKYLWLKDIAEFFLCLAGRRGRGLSPGGCQVPWPPINRALKGMLFCRHLGSTIDRNTHSTEPSGSKSRLHDTREILKWLFFPFPAMMQDSPKWTNRTLPLKGCPSGSSPKVLGQTRFNLVWIIIIKTHKKTYLLQHSAG